MYETSEHIALDLRGMEEGDMITLKTKKRDYTLIVTAPEYGIVMIQGGVIFHKPSRAVIIGSRDGDDFAVGMLVHDAVVEVYATHYPGKIIVVPTVTGLIVKRRAYAA